MATQIKVPTLGESVTSATVARWLKQAGDAVAVDEPLVELETDKVTVEVNAPAAGRLTQITAEAGAEVPVGAVLGIVSDTTGPSRPVERARPAAMPSAGVNPPPTPSGPVARPAAPAEVPPLPAAAKLLTEHHLEAAAIGAGTGKEGRITKGDVLEFLARPVPPPPAPAAKPVRAPEDGEERVRMTRLRR